MIEYYELVGFRIIVKGVWTLAEGCDGSDGDVLWFLASFIFSWELLRRARELG